MLSIELSSGLGLGSVPAAEELFNGFIHEATKGFEGSLWLRELRRAVAAAGGVYSWLSSS